MVQAMPRFEFGALVERVDLCAPSAPRYQSPRERLSEPRRGRERTRDGELRRKTGEKSVFSMISVGAAGATHHGSSGQGPRRSRQRSGLKTQGASKEGLGGQRPSPQA